uniref:Mediator of RNA polymerase II transcription subunit 22 n=1 Tax=Capra hircus TaxID=9925 RepID=A0A8C2SBX6_CAPHI
RGLRRRRLGSCRGPAEGARTRGEPVARVWRKGHLWRACPRVLPRLVPAARREAGAGLLTPRLGSRCPPPRPTQPEAPPWPSREPCRRARRRCCSLTTSGLRTTSSPSWTTSPRSSRPPRTPGSSIDRLRHVECTQIEDETQVSRATQGEQDNYEMHVRAANIVRAGESLMKLVSDLKQFLILNDFPSVNEAIDQRNQQLRALQEESDRKLIALRDEVSIDLYELEEEYYSSRYK